MSKSDYAMLTDEIAKLRDAFLRAVPAALDDHRFGEMIGSPWSVLYCATEYLYEQAGATMSDSVDGAKLWCIVRVENSACFTGYSEEAFRAIAYATGENHLTFSLLSGGRKVFNWHKVLWFDTSDIVEKSEPTP